MFSKIKKNGFTLVELLVVISIMGVLMAVVIGNFSSARTTSRDAERVSDIKRMQLALGLYFSVNTVRQYPTADNLSTALVTGGYIDRIPTDPLTNNPYVYVGIGSSGKCSSYYLATSLEDPNSKYIKDSAVFNTSASACTTGTDANNRATLSNMPTATLYLTTPNN